MNYLNFKTRSLRVVTGHWKGGGFPWELLGSSKEAIIMDDIPGSNQAPSGDKIAYLLPIVNRDKANEFVVSAGAKGCEVVILTEEQAFAKWEEYKAAQNNITS